jgi:hypothetical protein
MGSRRRREGECDVQSRRSLALAAALVALLTAACERSAVVDAAPEAPPYRGPLVVEVTAPPSGQTADRSGAAGQVVDCDSETTGDVTAGPYDGGEVWRSPEVALTQAVGEAFRGVTEGFREARRETDRVLYTFEVDRRVKQAYIVHRGPAVDGHTGWYVESWARCDFAELPEAVAELVGLQIWTDATGRRVPTSRVESQPGSEHCDWQDMTFLSLDGGDFGEGETYVRKPHPDYYPDYFAEPYVAAQDLPAGARDTGYELDGRHLWISVDRRRAYVGTRDSVESWPRTTQLLGCA